MSPLGPPMQANTRLIRALCEDWLEGGLRYTARADRVREIFKQSRERGEAKNLPASDHDRA